MEKTPPKSVISGIFDQFEENIRRRAPETAAEEKENVSLFQEFGLLPTDPRDPPCLDQSHEMDASELRKQPQEGVVWWQTKFEFLSDTARKFEEECHQQLSNPSFASNLLQVELAGELNDIQEESRLWNEALWDGLRQIRCRLNTACSMSQDCMISDDFFEQGEASCTELQRYKQKQKEDFERLSDFELQLEEVFEVVARRAETWVTAGNRQRPSSAPPRESEHDVAALRNTRNESKHQRQVLHIARLTEADSEMKRIREEIAALDDEIKKLGAASTWSNAEHNIFLRLFQSYDMQATPAFISKVLSHISSSMTENDVFDHVRWAGDLEAKNSRRRSLLTRWRNRRYQLEQQATVEQDGENNKAVAESRRTKERERNEQVQRRKRVKQWREDRAEQERRACVERAVAHQANEQAEKEASAIQQQAKRELLQAFVRMKEMQHANAISEPKLPRRQTLSREVLARISRRNSVMLQRKLQHTSCQQRTPSQRTSTASPRSSEPPSLPSSARGKKDVCQSLLRKHTQSSRMKMGSKSILDPGDSMDLPVSSEPKNGPRSAHLKRVLRAASLRPYSPCGSVAIPPTLVSEMRPSSAPPSRWHSPAALPKPPMMPPDTQESPNPMAQGAHLLKRPPRAPSRNSCHAEIQPD